MFRIEKNLLLVDLKIMYAECMLKKRMLVQRFFYAGTTPCMVPVTYFPEACMIRGDGLVLLHSAGIMCCTYAWSVLCMDSMHNAGFCNSSLALVPHSQTWSHTSILIPYFFVPHFSFGSLLHVGSMLQFWS